MGNVWIMSHSSSFPKRVVYITHNAILSLSDITGGSSSDYKQLPLEPRKALCSFFP